ncbi:MAG: amidohydrolase family protein [Bacteroidota bacterium]
MSANKLILAARIVTCDDNENVLINHAIEIQDDIITRIAPLQQFDLSKFSGEMYDYSEYTLIPGFVQTHIHLCQTLFRGLADDLELLDWLQNKIFPYENAHNAVSLSASVRLGLHELLSSGTTTIVDMGTLRNQEIIFDELIYAKIRAFAGKCMIDENDLSGSFKESTDENLKSSYELAKEFHNIPGGRIKYAFAPRFALSCSEKLMRETKEIMKDFPGSFLHTHSSENKHEVEAVRKKYGKENIEYFDSINLLDDHTVLAHCIHLNDKEIKSLKNNSVRVAHCPSSNLKLGSGIANIPGYLKEGISVSLGADGAPCNNNLSAFTEMRFASLIQKPVHGPTVMDPKTVFKLATIEGAKALHMGNEIGSIEVGKKADIVLLDLERTELPLDKSGDGIYSSIVYSANKENVKEVMIGGEWVVSNGDVLIYDERELVEDGKSELMKLLSRAYSNNK